jgi:hypothetical protein
MWFFSAGAPLRVHAIDSGVRDSEDPTIMAWELANEPRCDGDFSGSRLQVSRPLALPPPGQDVVCVVSNQLHLVKEYYYL